MLRKVAKDYKDKLIFVFVDFETETGPQVVNFFGVDEKQLPDYVIFEVSQAQWSNIRKVVLGNFVLTHDHCFLLDGKTNKVSERWKVCD